MVYHNGAVIYLKPQKKYRKPKKLYKKQEMDFTSYIPFLHVRRVSSSELGRGVLGRYYPLFGQIDIGDWIHGDDFEEVYTHEARHAMNPASSERDVRDFTRNTLKKKRWH
jgi:hypothetical protein